MNNWLGLLMKSVFFLSLIFGRDTYQSIRLYDPSPSNIEVVASLGIPLDHVGGKRGVYLETKYITTRYLETKDTSTKLIDK